MKTPTFPTDALRGSLRRLVSLFRRKPKPQLPAPVWEGKCACCGGRVYSLDAVPENPATTECTGCAMKWTDASKKRADERRQIELIKTAIRELEAEKANNDSTTASR